jgi:hypothetical protein
MAFLGEEEAIPIVEEYKEALNNQKNNTTKLV